MSNRPFWEAWGAMEARYAGVRLLVVVLGAAVVALSFTVAAVARRPDRIVVVPGAREHMIVERDSPPEKYVKELGKSLLFSLANYTYRNVEEAYAEPARMMSPKILSQFDLRTRQKIEEARRSQVSESFIPEREGFVTDKDAYTVRLEGVRRVYVGRREVGEPKPYFYELTFGERPRDLKNPLGLEIVGIRQGEVSDLPARSGTGPAAAETGGQGG